MTAHISVNGNEYELADVTHVQLAHTESAAGTMVSLRMQGNQVLGYLNVGPGCFVTVGNPPTKAGRTLAQRKAGGRTLTLNIPNTQPVEAATQAIPQGSR